MALRMPRRRLLLVTPGHAERVAGRGEWYLTILGRMHCVGGRCSADDDIRRDADALVGVTGEGLAYQERSRFGVVQRALTAILAVAAVVGSAAGAPVRGTALLGTSAIVLWAIGRVTEAYGRAGGFLEFERIGFVDATAQRFDGVGRWGTLYRIGVDDPADFRLISDVAAEHGTGAS